MKKFRSHLFNQVAVLLAISFLCLNLEACNNFLNGDEVKNEIEKVIDYNNAKSLNVMISCPEDYQRTASERKSIKTTLISSFLRDNPRLM
jgi:hypothetical protein